METNKGMSEEDLQKSNRAKYGEKEFDLISQHYRISKEQGDVWCSGNVIRYLDRFKRPNSTKSNNMIDLLKARDYLDRMIEENQKLLVVKDEIIEK